MSQLKLALSLILLLIVSFVSVFADTTSQLTNSQSTSEVPQTKSVQNQILQQIISLLHFKSGYLPFEISEKQIVEYSIITAIILIIIIVIASSVRSKNKKPSRK